MKQICASCCEPLESYDEAITINGSIYHFECSPPAEEQNKKSFYSYTTNSEEIKLQQENRLLKERLQRLETAALLIAKVVALTKTNRVMIEFPNKNKFLVRVAIGVHNIRVGEEVAVDQQNFTIVSRILTDGIEVIGGDKKCKRKLMTRGSSKMRRLARLCSRGLVKMGADITFENGDYYRDSYNDSNLAWIVGESYWACKNQAQRNKMMEKLAHIPDKLIIKYVDSKIKNSFKLSGESEKFKRKEWLKCFIDKRNQLKKLLDAGELKVAKDGWSV